MSIQGSLGDAGASSTSNDINDALTSAQPANSREEVQQQNQSEKLDRLVEARARHNDNLERQLTPGQRNTLSKLPPHERRIAMQFMNQGQGSNMPHRGPAGDPPHNYSDLTTSSPISKPMAKSNPEPTAQLGKTEYTAPSSTSGTPITPTGTNNTTTRGVTQGAATPGGQLGSIEGPAIPNQVDNPANTLSSSQATPTGSSAESGATTQSGQTVPGTTTPSTPGINQGAATPAGELGSIDGPAIPNQVDNPANTPSSSQATPTGSSAESGATTQSGQTVPGTTTPSTPGITQGAATPAGELGSIDGPAIPNQVDNPASAQVIPGKPAAQASTTAASSSDTDNVAAVSEQAGATVAQNAANTTTTTGTQNVQQTSNTNAAQTIAEIANKIVDSIRVMDARPMGGSQEVVIKLGADVLPGTEVNIAMKDGQLNITFSTKNAQSASFLTETTLSQLTSNLQNSLNSQDPSNNRQVQVSVANPDSGAATEDGVTRREEGSGGGGGNSNNQGDQPQE